MSSSILKYVNLIDDFQFEKIDAKQFEKDFLQIFKNDEESIDYSEEILDILDTLFSAVDDYCNDPQLRSQLPRSLDEKDLLVAAKLAVERLRVIVN